MSIRPPASGGSSNAYTPGGTDVAVADGGTGASTAAGARTNLGVPALVHAGSLLAVVAYNPGVLAAYDSTSTTMAVKDTTNLRLTFTAPPSGNVVGVLAALCSFADPGATSAQMEWAVMDGAAVVSGSRARVFAAPDVNANSVQHRVVHRFRVSGLTPDTSYSWDWAAAREGGTVTAQFFAGGVAGQAVMEAWAAP